MRRVAVLTVIILGMIVVLALLKAQPIQDGKSFPSSTDESFQDALIQEADHQLFVVLSPRQGDIFNASFLKTLQQVTEDIFYLPGVDRTKVLSITRSEAVFGDVVEDGLESHPIIPEHFSYANTDDYDLIRVNLLKSPYLGRLVAKNFQSAMVVVPILAAVDGEKVMRQIKKILPKNQSVKFEILGEASMIQGFKQEMTWTLFWVFLSLIGARGIHFLFEYSDPLGRSVFNSQSDKKISWVKHWGLCFLLLTVSLSLWPELFVGHRGSGSPLLRDNAPIQKAHKKGLSPYLFAVDSFLVFASDPIAGVEDPKTIRALEQFEWILNGYSQVRCLSSLAGVVKQLNVFFHENNLLWYAIPREQETLKTALRAISPQTGLLDDSGSIMPVRIFFDNHYPETINPVYEMVKKFPHVSSMSFILAGGIAGTEAMKNDMIRSWFLPGFLLFAGLLFGLVCGFLPGARGIYQSFILCVIWSVVLGMMAYFHFGINQDSLTGLMIGSLMCVYLMIRGFRPVGEKEQTRKLIIIIAVALTGGLLSKVNLVFIPVLMIEMMLVLLWIIDFALDPSLRETP